MGFDLEVYLLYGYKLSLAEAFTLIKPGILDEDDWQVMGDSNYRDEIIERYVTSPDLKAILNGEGGWNIRILTSTQEECDPDNSYFFLYNKREELYSGGCPDYETGEIPSSNELEGALFLQKWKYSAHWIVEGSW